MKFIILFSLIAIAIAAPRDEKTPLSQSQPASTLDSHKAPLNSDSKAKAPIAAASKPKRESPKSTDLKNVHLNTPVNNNNNNNNAQKNAAAPSPVASNTRHTRDTQQNSYKPQASGIPQKSNAAPSPVASPDLIKKPSNARPSRETPKTNTNTQLKDDKTKTPVTNTQNLPQKNSAPATVAKAPQQNSRNRRDAPVKPAENNQKPVEWNKDEKKVNSQPQQSHASAHDNRKTRETPKTGTNTQLKEDKTKNASPVQHPEVAKVPLASTYARNRRDTPNPIDQSKLVPSASISGKPNSPAQQARVGQTQSNGKTNDNLNIRRPAPVDQVLGHKSSSSVVQPAATENTKPQENANKKV